MTFDFDTSAYVRNYGSDPRGRGGWGFQIEGGEPVFSPSMIYADARKWAREQAKQIAPAGYRGVVCITVCT